VRQLFAVLQLKAEFRRDDDAIAIGLESLADQFLVGVRAVQFCRVKEGNTALNGGPQQGYGVLLFEGLAVREIKSHTAEADGAHFQPALTKLAFLHDASPLRYCSSVTFSIQS